MSNRIIKLSRNTENAPINAESTQSVAFSHYNNISAQLPIEPKTGKLISNEVKEQALQCLKNIESIVKSIDHVKEDIIKITVFVKNIDDTNAIDSIYADFFQNEFPTRTVVAVADLPMDNALVQMDALISNGEGTYPQAPCALLKMARNTNNAPTNEVSTQTVAFSHYNNISAQLPIDPVTNQLITGDVTEQTTQCLKNIKAILESIDVPFDDIVKVNIFHKNASDIDAINKAYTTFFPDSAIARTHAYVPARTTVIAADLPMGALVQIDVVVSHGDGTPPQAIEDRHGIVIKANNTNNAPLNALSTQTVAFSHYNHISVQLPINPQSNKVEVNTIAEQTEQCLNNIKAIVESINHEMDDIVKVNIQLKDISDITTVNEIYTSFFNSELPARTVIGVSDISMNALIQIDAVVSNAEGTPPQQ